MGPARPRVRYSNQRPRSRVMPSVVWSKPWAEAAPTRTSTLRRDQLDVSFRRKAFARPARHRSASGCPAGARNRHWLCRRWCGPDRSPPSCGRAIGPTPRQRAGPAGPRRPPAPRPPASPWRPGCRRRRPGWWRSRRSATPSKRARAARKAARSGAALAASRAEAIAGLVLGAQDAFGARAGGAAGGIGGVGRAGWGGLGQLPGRLGAGCGPEDAANRPLSLRQPRAVVPRRLCGVGSIASSAPHSI